MINQGEKTVLYEHPRRPDSHCRAYALLEYVPDDSEIISLHGDWHCVTVEFHRFPGKEVLTYYLPCGDPDLSEDEVIEKSFASLQNWAEKLCKLLDELPELWPVGD